MPIIKPNVPAGLKVNKPNLAKAFNAIFTPKNNKNPLDDITYTGDVEADSQAEVNEILTGFKDRAKAEQDRFALATDSEFWVAMCFQSREQKEVFLKALNWLQYGDKYIDGCSIADAIGIELPEVRLPKPTGVSGRLIGLASDLSRK